MVGTSHTYDSGHPREHIRTGRCECAVRTDRMRLKDLIRRPCCDKRRLKRCGVRVRRRCARLVGCGYRSSSGCYHLGALSIVIITDLLSAVPTLPSRWRWRGMLLSDRMCLCTLGGRLASSSIGCILPTDGLLQDLHRVLPALLARRSELAPLRSNELGKPLLSDEIGVALTTPGGRVQHQTCRVGQWWRESVSECH